MRACLHLIHARPLRKRRLKFCSRPQALRLLHCAPLVAVQYTPHVCVQTSGVCLRVHPMYALDVRASPACNSLQKPFKSACLACRLQQVSLEPARTRTRRMEQACLLMSLRLTPWMWTALSVLSGPLLAPSQSCLR